MGISKKKRRMIKQSYPARTVEEIAAATGIDIQEIKQVLQIQDPAKKRTSPDMPGHILEWGLPVCVFLSPFMMMPGLREASDYPQNAFVQVTTLVLAAVWRCRAATDKTLRFFYAPMTWPLAAFLAWTGVSVFISINPFEGIPVLFQVAALVGLFCLVLNLYGKDGNLDRIVLALVMSGGGIALIGICQYLFEFSMIPQARPPAATFSNRNMASQFMVLAFPFGVYLFLKTKEKHTAWMSAAATVFMLVFVVYTKALAAWISIGVESIVLAAGMTWLMVKGEGRERIRSRLPLVAAAAAAFLILINMDSTGFNLGFGGVGQQVASVQKFVSSPESNAGVQKKAGVTTIQWRWAIWKNSLAMIRDHLILGVGPGNYQIVYPLYNYAVVKDPKFTIQFQPARAHNDYIQAFSEFGLVGFCIILWAVACFFYILVVLLKRAPPGNRILFILGLAAAGTGILINGAFSFPFQRAIPPYITLLISGMAAALYVREKKSLRVHVTKPSVLYCLAAGMVVLCLVAAHFHYSRIQFDRYYARSVSAYNNARWPELIREAKKAMSYSTQRKEILFYLGYANDKLGRIEESNAYYHELLSYFPNYINGLINLAVGYGKVNRIEESVEMYKRVVKILPEHAGYHNNIGHFLQKMGKLDEAWTYFDKARKLDRDNAIIWCNIGSLHLAMRDIEAAKAAFERALELKPGWERPMKYLDFIEKREKEKSEN